MSLEEYLELAMDCCFCHPEGDRSSFDSKISSPEILQEGKKKGDSDHSLTWRGEGALDYSEIVAVTSLTLLALHLAQYCGRIFNYII